MDKIISLIGRFKFRTKKLIDFIKLGWNDQDYDSGYMLILIDYKLKKMEHMFNTSSIHAENDRMAKVCRVAHKALHRYHEVDYFTKYNNKKMPFKVKMGWGESEHPGLKRTIWLREDTDLPLSTEELKIMRKNTRRAANFELRMQKKYRRIFFRTLYKYLEQLWD